jgi:hypothetical protein
MKNRPPSAALRASLACVVLAWAGDALAWHDTGHMVVAQIAYLRLTPAARARVDSLLVTPPGRRPLIHLCAGVYRAETCERTYDPITIAVWMDDFRGDSLNEPYARWHYINFAPLFDGVPARSNAGPNADNVLARINWAIDVLRAEGNEQKAAETLGFLYHLVGDVHQPLHAATRYSQASPDGDSGGNGFRIEMPPGTGVSNLHAFWDAAGGAFGFNSPARPLDAAARARIRALADELMSEHPADTAPWRSLAPYDWVVESNRLARETAYPGIAEGQAPSAAYTAQARRVSRRRIAIAAYRLAGVLNALFVP